MVARRATDASKQGAGQIPCVLSAVTRQVRPTHIPSRLGNYSYAAVFALAASSSHVRTTPT